ncbi:hypothetical protein ACSU1N_02340 [Thermogladius sp. 4427co]|uniref:hypothetical protein n=1 Tax=Thermogladius sp. 4427co TaxID=3450718 RepID=UPI003F799CB0
MELVLSGADGSGKTTTAKLLYNHLASRNIVVCLHWFRGSHFLASILLRFLSRFRGFQGLCNPYYRVCLPGKLKPLWIHIEFLSFLPYLLARLLLKRVCLVVGDRGILDFTVWLVTTLGEPGVVSGFIGRFLLRMASRESSVYLYADPEVLAGRADVPRGFLLRELAVYKVLSRYFARISLDTGRYSPAQVAARVLDWLRLA